MGRWMQRVAQPGKTEKGSGAEPTELTKPPFVSSVSAPSGPFPKISDGFVSSVGAPTGEFEKNSDPAPMASDGVSSVLSVRRPGLSENFSPPDPADIEERAALIEDGGIPRAWADGLARLASMPPPDGWGSDWRAVRDGVLRFADDLAGHWLAKAVALGWTEVDLFGAAPTAPAARLDARGAATFIKGASIMAITADAIVIRTPSGQRLRITRPTTKGGAPLWEVR